MCFLLMLNLFYSLSAKNCTDECSPTIGLHPFLETRLNAEFIALRQFRLQLSILFFVLQRQLISCSLVEVTESKRSLLSPIQPTIKGVEREKCHQVKDILLFSRCNEGGKGFGKHLWWC